MDITIERNQNTGGECCYFTHNGQEYYADRSYTMDHGMETMIFPAQDGEVTSWSELYCDRSGQSLEECINEFIS